MSKKLALACAVSLSTLLAAQTPAFADSFSIQYFTAVTNTPDFHNGNPDGPIGTSLNYVKPSLGPDGMPVFNPGFTADTGTVNAPDPLYLNSRGEILYWTPGSGLPGSTIQAVGSGLITLGADPVNMFPPGQTNDATNELTAIIRGSFSVPANGSDTITFNIGADDTVFLYVDGQLTESLGGVHGWTPVNSIVSTYGPGNHDIEIFYADHDVKGASLSFTDDSNLVITPTSVTPEPSSFVLLGSGLLGAVGVIRRRLCA